MTRRLVLVEKKLVADNGHEWTQIENIKKLLPEHELLLVTGDNYDGSAGPEVARLPLLGIRAQRYLAHWRSGPMRDKIRSLRRLFKYCLGISWKKKAFTAELSKVLVEQSIGSGDVIIIPSAGIDDLESISEAINITGCKSAVILRFIHQLIGEVDDDVLAWRMGRVRKILPPNIHLFTEAPEMASMFSQRYALNVKGGFFLPCTFDPETEPVASRPEDGIFRVGFLGVPSVAKGIDMIPDIARELIALGAEKMGIRLAVQVNCKNADSRDLLEAVRNCSLMEIHDAGMSAAEFSEFFLSCDLLALPYKVTEYGVRGSGILQDAVAVALPVVHTKGLGMQNLVAFGNAIAAESSVEFAEAIVQVLQHRETYKAQAICARAQYRGLLKDLAEDVKRLL